MPDWDTVLYTVSWPGCTEIGFWLTGHVPEIGLSFPAKGLGSEVIGNVVVIWACVELTVPGGGLSGRSLRLKLKLKQD